LRGEALRQKMRRLPNRKYRVGEFPDSLGGGEMKNEGKMTEKRVYLDYNATTPVSAEANAAIWMV
jgi:hypothetical protein